MEDNEKYELISGQIKDLQLPEEYTALLQESAKSYLSIQTQGTGKEFWEEYILSQTKDYNHGMEFFQAARELQVRLHKIFSESIDIKKTECERDLLLVKIKKIDKKISESEDELEAEELSIKKKKLEILAKEAQGKIEFTKISMKDTYREVKDFKEISDQYAAKGIPSYKEARMKDMQQRMVDRYINYVIYNTPLSPPEMGFFWKDGLIVPPIEAINKLKKLGFEKEARIEELKLWLYEKKITKNEYDREIFDLTNPINDFIKIVQAKKELGKALDGQTSSNQPG